MKLIDIRTISFADIWAASNIDALLAEYAEESSLSGLPTPVPLRDLYELLEQSGSCVLLGAYKGDELVGFLAMVVSMNPHYSQVLAVTESYFVASEHRKTGAGLRLLTAAESLAKAKGAIGILVSAPVQSRLAQVMPGVGYRETTRAFFRSLA